MKQSLISISLFLLLSGAYVGGYVANLDEGVRSCYSPALGARVRLPYYRTGGKLADYFFWPAFRADLDLRPERWPEPLIFT